MKYQIHPLAETYPPMSEAEMEALTADIAARGLRHPIVLYDGKILDGRNRYTACQRAGIEPTFVEYEGDDPLDEVNSLNLNRDLTAGQRAFVAARQWMLKGDTKGSGRREKSQTATFSVKSLAKKFRASDNTISAARDILTEAPDLAVSVEMRTASLAEVTEELERRRTKVQQQARDAAKVAEYSEAISNGEMSLQDALQAAMEQEREEKERLRLNAEARQLWFDALAGVVKCIRERVASRDDDELAWYREGIVTGESNAVTAEQVRETVVQLQRIEAITLKEDVNGRADEGRGSRSKKSREAGI